MEMTSGDLSSLQIFSHENCLKFSKTEGILPKMGVSPKIQRSLEVSLSAPLTHH